MVGIKSRLGMMTRKEVVEKLMNDAIRKEWAWRQLTQLDREQIRERVERGVVEWMLQALGRGNTYVVRYLARLGNTPERISFSVDIGPRGADYLRVIMRLNPDMKIRECLDTARAMEVIEEKTA